jgi:site-specific recombinase XerD
MDTQKRAIRFDQIELIEKFETKPNTRLHLAKSIFLFSFYTMGTNLVDMANLTWENVKDDRIKYIRAKTHKPYNIFITSKAKGILEHFRNTYSDKYVFPIYSENAHITAQQKANRLHKIMQQVNEDLKEIAKLCSINEKITTYVARHSSATILKRKGVSTTVISELLGHNNEEITQVYLDSFESPVLDTAVSLL